MFRRSSSGDSLSLRDFADDFFSMPSPSPTFSKSSPTDMNSSNPDGSLFRRSRNSYRLGNDYNFSVGDLAPSRRSSNRLSSRDSTGHEGRSSKKLSRRGSTGHIFDHSFSGEEGSSRSKSRSNGMSRSQHGSSENLSASLRSFSALLRTSAMESEMRKSSMKQDDVRSKSNGFFGSTKSNGFFDMPSPPFHLSENDLSPNDVRSNNNIGGYTPTSRRSSSTNNQDDDKHCRRDEALRSSKSSYKPQSSRRQSSPAENSHSPPTASETWRSSRRSSLPERRPSHNKDTMHERQRSMRRGSSFSTSNTKINPESPVRRSSSKVDMGTKINKGKPPVRSSSTSDNLQKRYPSTSHVEKYLQHYADALRLPTGFLKSIVKAYKSIDSRLWLMENSSSMKTRDGHRAKIDAQLKHIKREDGHSRWAELTQTVDFHVKMSARCFIPTKFWLVNDPGPSVGPQRFAVAWGSHDDVKTERTIALDMMNRVRLDADQIPLARQLRKIEKRVREEIGRAHV